MTGRENILRTIKRCGPEWIPFRGDGSLTLLRPSTVVRPACGTDDWGVNWTATDGDSAYPQGNPVVHIENIERFVPPATDWGDVEDDLSRQVEALRSEDTLIIAYNELTLFERAHLLMGFTQFLEALILSPDRVAVLLDRIVDYQCALTRCLMRAGVDGVRFTDDWGMQTGLLISPDLWRLHIKPRMQSLYDIVKLQGGLVFHHSCGRIDDILRDIVQMGVDVIDPCQPSANDIRRWKQEYGDQICFMGGLDTQTYLSFGTPSEVQAAVCAVLHLMGQGGGFIAAPSHTITIPEENRAAMVRAIASYNARLGAA